MKFVVNEKLYDTEKSELLCTFKKQWEVWNSLFNRNFYHTRETSLYKTFKGAYFIISKGDNDKYVIEVINEHTAKQYLIYNAYDKYCELFEPLEEA